MSTNITNDAVKIKTMLAPYIHGTDVAVQLRDACHDFSLRLDYIIREEMRSRNKPGEAKNVQN